MGCVTSLDGGVTIFPFAILLQGAAKGKALIFARTGGGEKRREHGLVMACGRDKVAR